MNPTEEDEILTTYKTLSDSPQSHGPAEILNPSGSIRQTGGSSWLDSYQRRGSCLAPASEITQPGPAAAQRLCSKVTVKKKTKHIYIKRAKWTNDGCRPFIFHQTRHPGSKRLLQKAADRPSPQTSHCQVNMLRLQWHLQVGVCAPVAPGCVVGKGGSAEEGVGPRMEAGGCRTEEAR